MKKFRDCVREWLDNYKRNSVKEATFDRLETSFKLMDNYKIAWLGIDQLDTDYIQDYLNSLVDDGYAISTIKKQYHLITSFMDHATVKGIVDRPYHKGVKMPSRTIVKKKTREVVSYDETEQKKLNDVFDTLEHPAYAAGILMFETGMRIGEVLAVGWDDVDWRRRAIHVNKTYVRLGSSGKSFIQQEAKSYFSNRPIPLSQRAYDTLKTLKDRDRFDEFIIHDSKGNHLGYEAVRWQISKVCKSVGVPYLGLHVFRHTFATNCYYRGCDVKRLSKLLGHADVNVTYNVYIHLFGDDLEDLRSVLG